MNGNLLEWIFERRAKVLSVSRKIIMVKGKAMHGEIYATDPRLRDTFTALKGCFQTFMSRNGLSLRRKTTVGQHGPA